MYKDGYKKNDYEKDQGDATRKNFGYSSTYNGPDYVIKQIMPIPEGYTVMYSIDQEDGRQEMIGEEECTFKSCLALVDYDNGTSDVVPFDMVDGHEIDPTATIVKIRHCPKCGREMVPYQKTITGPLRYHCACGNDLDEDFWGMLVPGEEGFEEGPQGEARYDCDNAVPD